jgi:acyl carrier protein
MTYDEALPIVLKAAAEYCLGDVTPETPIFRHDSELDSLSQVEVVMAVENAIGRDLGTPDATYGANSKFHSLLTVADIAKTVAALTDNG